MKVSGVQIAVERHVTYVWCVPTGVWRYYASTGAVTVDDQFLGFLIGGHGLFGELVIMSQLPEFRTQCRRLLKWPEGVTP